MHPNSTPYPPICTSHTSWSGLSPLRTPDVSDQACHFTHLYDCLLSPVSFLPHPPLSLENTKLLITPLGAIIVRARELTYWFQTFFSILSPHQDAWLWRQADTGRLIIQTGSLFFTPQLTAIHLPANPQHTELQSTGAIKTQTQHLQSWTRNCFRWTFKYLS